MRLNVREFIEGMGIMPIVRLVAALLCFAIAIPLMVLLGPAFVFWLAGLMILGFSLRDVVRFVHRHTPGLSEEDAEKVVNHRIIRKIDRLFGNAVAEDDAADVGDPD